MRLALFTLLALVLASCEKNTYYLKTVENRSKVDVDVEVYWNVVVPRSAFFTLRPGEKYMFREQSEKGLQSAAPKCFTDIDSLKVYHRHYSGHRYRVMLDWKKSGSWEHSKAEVSNYVEHSCTFVIDSTDIFTPF